MLALLCPGWYGIIGRRIMPPTIGLQQVNCFTLARHGLLNRAWRDPVAAAGDLFGPHAQVRTASALSLWCRLADFERRTLDDALYRQRSLVKRWFMRGTLHLVPTTDFRYTTVRSRKPGASAGVATCGRVGRVSARRGIAGVVHGVCQRRVGNCTGGVTRDHAMLLPSCRWCYRTST
jgi:hypothetical protein